MFSKLHSIDFNKIYEILNVEVGSLRLASMCLIFDFHDEACFGDILSGFMRVYNHNMDFEISLSSTIPF